MQPVESYENKNGKLPNDLEGVAENDLLSKLIEIISIKRQTNNS